MNFTRQFLFVKSRLIGLLRKHGVIMTICFIIGLVVINFGLFFHNRLSLMKSLETKKEIELVENSINRLWSLVQLADLGIRGYLLIPEKQMLSPFDEAITQYPWKPF